MNERSDETGVGRTFDVDALPMNETNDGPDVQRNAGWIFYGVAPVLPLLIGAGLLQFLTPPEPLNGVETLELSEQAAGFSHLGDLLTYGAAALLQMSICIGVITLQAWFFRKLSTAARRTAYRVMLLAIALAAGIFTLIWVTKSAPYMLTYNVTRQVMLLSPGWPAEFAADGDKGILLGQSQMFYACLVPFVLGAMVVAIVAALGAAVAGPDNMRRADWESVFSERVAQLQRSFQASSLVLVASTISLMLFVQLPSRLLSESGSESLSRFGLGLTLYWGVVMTLTLFATFAPPVIALYREAIEQHHALEPNQSFGQWLSERGDLSVKRQISNLGTMLAPIMVGPVGVLIQSVLGS